MDLLPRLAGAVVRRPPPGMSLVWDPTQLQKLREEMARHPAVLARTALVRDDTDTRAVDEADPCPVVDLFTGRAR